MIEGLFDWLRRRWDTHRHGPVRYYSVGATGCQRHHADGFVRAVATIPVPKADRGWLRKQAAAAPARYYGGNVTLQGTTELGIETRQGTVVAVWFRCQALPFQQTEVAAQRATEMQTLYGQPQVRLTGVEVLDPPEETRHA